MERRIPVTLGRPRHAVVSREAGARQPLHGLRSAGNVSSRLLEFQVGKDRTTSELASCDARHEICHRRDQHFGSPQAIHVQQFRARSSGLAVSI